ncbi:MAG TPA: protein kinase [Pseudonocardia sp.]|jgi:hypothetical protein|nr:protein kinase [Pseudonocardia sp.]
MIPTGDSSDVVLAQRYRVDERIGVGSMGAVWRATDQLLNRVVAVKQILLNPGVPGFDAQAYEEAKQRIQREGRLAARLQHAHTVAVFDVVEHEGAPWLVMEYLPSRTLGALLDADGPMEPKRAAEIGVQIADGLAAAHAAGIVHRDIKPGNVLIGTEGQVKITDFGVSRAADDVQLTRTGMIAGTPAFLSPEVARGRTPTPASDVFALGSTLYAAVEGTPPFGLDDNAFALLYAVGEGKVEPPKNAGPLTEPLMRMLRKKPEERPSADEVREELEAVLRGRALPATGPVRPAVPVTAGDRHGVGAPTSPAASSAEALVSTKIDLAPVIDPPAGPPGRAADATPTRVRITGGRRSSALVAVLVAVLLIAAVVVLLIVRGQGHLGTTSPTTTPGSVPGVVVTGPPTAAQLEDFVRQYYGLLPADPQTAWQMLGPPAREASHGYDSYEDFYGSLSGVQIVEGPTAIGQNTVRATLRFIPKNGGTSTETYRFTVVAGSGGKLVMSSFAR